MVPETAGAQIALFEEIVERLPRARRTRGRGPGLALEPLLRFEQRARISGVLGRDACVVLRHSKRRPVSKCTHWTHACRSVPHFPQRLSPPIWPVMMCPQRAHRTTCRYPGML